MDHLTAETSCRFQGWVDVFPDRADRRKEICTAAVTEILLRPVVEPASQTESGYT